MSVTITIPAERLAGWHRRWVERITPGLLAKAAAGALQALVMRHLQKVARERHNTASRLGATPTGFWAGAAQAVRLHTHANDAEVSVTHPGIARAVRDVLIRPRRAKALAIPLHAEAYALFCKIEDDLPFDNAVLYFKAVSAYNCGRKRESLEAFDKIQTIYIDAVTAKYYMDFVREHMAEDDNDFLEHPLSYFYRLPQEERESNISLLTAFVMLEPKAAVALSDQLDLSDCIRWCFDEGGENSPEEIKLLGASAAAMAPSCEDIFRDILLDGFLSDRVKIHALAAVAECNRGGEYGVVVCNIYRKIKLPVLSVGRAKRKQFLRAYGVAVARFALIDPDYAYVIKDAATELHARLAANKGFAAVKTPAALAAAICACGGISGVIGEKAGPDEMCAYFAADRKEFDKIMGGAN